MSTLAQKNPWRRAALAALSAAAVLLGSALSPAPAQAVPGDGQGTVVVKVVDAAGQPLKALVSLVRTTGGSPVVGNSGADTITQSLSAGRYGVTAWSPWGGVFCAGVSPCTSAGMPAPGTVTGAFDVTDVETPTTITLQAPAPATVTGGNLVGATRTVVLSPQMQTLNLMLASGGTVTTEWLRDGTPITGALGQTYTLTTDDVGHTVAPRLTYGGSAPLLTGLGLDATPLTLPGQLVAKAISRTTVEVFRTSITAGKSTGLRADVTSGAVVPEGQVVITVGRWTATKTLRNGSVRVPLPKKLKPGTYRVVATYLGSPTQEGSTGSDKLTVKKKKKK